jgi:hypothetical protein
MIAFYGVESLMNSDNSLKDKSYLIDDRYEEGFCHWDNMQARPAAEVLSDMPKWFEDLIEQPGWGEASNIRWSEGVEDDL